MASVLLSRLIGFARESIIAAQEGATAQTDAYFAAFTLPDMLNYFLAGGTLSITFIPLFSAHLARDDEEGAWRLFSTVATGVGLLTLVAVLAGELLAPALVPLLVPGFDAEQLALCVRLTRIVTPAMLCFTLGGLLQATLLSRESFSAVAPVPILYNVAIIVGGVALGPWLGVEGFAWGALAGAIAGPLALPLWAARKHIKYTPRFDFTSPAFRAYLRLALPLMLGATLVSMDEWILRYFASSLDGGTVSWLNNARRLMLVPVAFLGQATAQAALPFLSRLYAESKHEELAQVLTRSLQQVVFWSLLAAGALASLGWPVVYLAFRHGDFLASDARATAGLLAVLALGLTAWAAQNLIARGYYARQDTLQPMALGTAVVVLSLPLYAALHDAWGAAGLALASSLAITLNALVMLLFYRWRHAPVSLRGLAASLGRALAAAAPATAAVYGLGLALAPQGPSSTLHAAGLLLGGGVVYAGVALTLARLLKAPELSLLQGLARKLRRKAS